MRFLKRWLYRKKLVTIQRREKKQKKIKKIKKIGKELDRVLVEYFIFSVLFHATA